MRRASNQRLQEVCDELSVVKRSLGEWTSLPGTQRAGIAATKLIEDVLREFFSRASPGGIRTGTGLRPTRDGRYTTDMDIVIDPAGEGWTSKVRLRVREVPVLAHLDVCGRTRWDEAKFHEDLGRLQETMDDARAHAQKTWTGLVAVGPGFASRGDDVMRSAHDFYHDRSIVPWPWNGRDVWPFVDAIVVPGMFLKKHDLFDGPTRSSQRWPVLYPFPVAGYEGLDDLWPLVAARAFLASFLRKALGQEDWEAAAWQDADNNEVLGGGALEERWPAKWSVVALRHDTPTELHHWIPGPPPSWQSHLFHSRPLCSHNRPYAIRPRPSFSKRRGHGVLHMLANDEARWHQVGSSDDRVVVELTFPESLSHEMERVRSEAEALGFIASAHRRFVRAAVDHPEEWSLEISAPYPVSQALQASPPGWCELRALVSPDLPSATLITPELVLPSLDRWLDAELGEGKWSYDRHALRSKTILNVVLIKFREGVSGAHLVVALHGEDVEVLDRM